MSDGQNPRLPDPASRPSRRSGRTEEQANAATFAALIGLAVICIGLITIVAMVLPQVRGLIFVFFGGVAFFGIHYVVWGWWLPRMLKPDDDTE